MQEYERSAKAFNFMEESSGYHNWNDIGPGQSPLNGGRHSTGSIAPHNYD